jgi:arabinose-5-phosphate isomerase
MFFHQYTPYMTILPHNPFTEAEAENIRQTARRTIEIEQATLGDLLAGINDDFLAAVNAIRSAPGRVVVTGIGKSAIVAQKIVATFNSTGTPAVFMHAADAIHGDLGMVRPFDVCICISKSGDTPEIKVLVPLLRNFGGVLVGMVSQKESFLGQQSDYILHTPITQEADPNNLAPTASTTAQMAMGDALATSLLALRGFTPQDFAQFHPGGSLGKQLYLRAHDLLAQHDAPPSVPLDAPLATVMLEMTAKRLGATAVLDKSGSVVGIITDGDLRRLMVRTGLSFNRKVTAQEIMTPNPVWIDADAMAMEALTLMRERNINQLVVLASNHDGLVKTYEGLIHIQELIQQGLV